MIVCREGTTVCVADAIVSVEIQTELKQKKMTNAIKNVQLKKVRARGAELHEIEASVRLASCPMKRKCFSA